MTTVSPISERLFDEIVEISKKVAPAFLPALQTIGPLDLEIQESESLSCFLARCIVGQQISAKAARTIWERVADLIDSHRSTVPEFFEESNSKRLRECGVSAQKVRGLIAIRTASKTGKLDHKRLQNLSSKDRSECLQQISGIGQWTCDMASIFYFDDRDVWPSSDGAIARAANVFLCPADSAVNQKIIESYKPYRGVLAQYLYKAIDSLAK